MEIRVFESPAISPVQVSPSSIRKVEKKDVGVRKCVWGEIERLIFVDLKCASKYDKNGCGRAVKADFPGSIGRGSNVHVKSSP